MWLVVLFVLTGVNKIVVNDSRATSLMLRLCISGLCSRVHMSSALAPSIASIPWEMGKCLGALAKRTTSIMPSTSKVGGGRGRPQRSRFQGGD